MEWSFGTVGVSYIGVSESDNTLCKIGDDYSDWKYTAGTTEVFSFGGYWTVSFINLMPFTSQSKTRWFICSRHYKINQEKAAIKCGYLIA